MSQWNCKRPGRSCGDPGFILEGSLEILWLAENLKIKSMTECAHWASSHCVQMITHEKKKRRAKEYMINSGGALSCRAEQHRSEVTSTSSR